MPKVVKPGADNQPEGTYIEVESNGGRVDGAVTIEIERGGGHFHRHRSRTGGG